MITLLEMGKIVMSMADAMPMAERAALDLASKLVLDETKAEFGTYQDAAGPFAAWPELAPSTIEDKERKGFEVPNPLVRTGETRDSYERVVIGRSAFVGSNSDIAVYQELGTDKIPPRSTLGGASVRKEPEIHEITARTVHIALIGFT